MDKSRNKGKTMKWMKGVGLILLCVSGGLYFGAWYIDQQLDQGKEQLAKGKDTVNKGNMLFSQTPVTKELGKHLTDSAQKKIDAGEEEITKYEKIASLLKVSSLIALGLGICTLIYYKMKY
ncbi:MAG: hypothetical protein NT065_01700 [Chlamydiae bacterium]|nr:hypothetical protein [Chlamydiota bacterium]